MKTFHTRENDLKQNIPSDCWFEYSVCVKGGNRQNDGNSRRKTEKVEVELYEEQFGGERENDSLRIQKKDIATTGIQSARGGGLLNWSACTCWRMPARFWHLQWAEGSPCQLLWSRFPWWLSDWRRTLSCLLPRRCLSCWRKSCRTPPREPSLPHTHSTHTLQRNERKSHLHYILY